MYVGGIISVLLIMLAVVGGLGMFALAAFTAIKGRPGIAALIIGGGLFAALACISVASVLWSMASRVVPGVVESAHIAPDGTQYWVSDQAAQPGVEHPHWTPDGQKFWPDDTSFVPPVNVGRTTWSFSLRPALFIGVGVIALLFVAARRGLSHSAAGGPRRLWPAFVALPLLAFLVIGGARWEASNTGAAAARRAAEMRESMLRQQQTFQRTFDEQRRQVVAKKFASAMAEIHKQIERLDIHVLMDKFDAPRIVLQTPVAPLGPLPGPATFLAAAATSANEAANKNATLETQPPAEETTADAEIAKKVDHESRASAQASTDPELVSDHKEQATREAAVAVEAEPPTPPTGPPVPPTPPAPAVAAGTTPEKLTIEGTASPTAVAPEKSTPAVPTWINDSPKRTGDIRREVIVTEEYQSVEECYRAADVYLMFKALERLEQLRGQPNAVGELPSVSFAKGAVVIDGQVIAVDQFPGTWHDHRLIPLSAMGITPEYLRREIVAKDPRNNESREYLETVSRSFGPMRKLYLQIEFTPAIDRELLRLSEAYSRQERFAVVGVGAGFVLTLLTGVWGLLKIDTATKGYYTKRLFFGVPAAIIGLIGIYVALVEAGFDLPH